ncbi:hypothetical protein [Blastococcus sp. SYSU DS0533]
MAAIVGLIFGAVQLWPKTTRLEVERFAVQDPTSVDAQLVDITGATPPSEGQVDSNTIDITLRNEGDEAAFVSQIEFNILYAKQMEDCQGIGGEVRASANYSVKFPTNIPEFPYPMTKDVSYEVAARDVDRMTLTVGPEEQSVSSKVPWVYVVEVALRYDEAKVLSAGTAALLARPGEGMEHLNVGIEIGDWDCIEANKSILDAAFDYPASRSAELEELTLAFTEALGGVGGAESAPAESVASATSVAPEEACARGEGQGVYVAEVCYTYTERELTARFILSGDPVARQTFLVMRISQADGQVPLRWPAMFFGDQWGIGFIREDDSSAELKGNGCGPCTIFGTYQQVEFTTPTGTDLTADTLLITTEVYEVVDPSNPTLVSAVDGGESLTVRRQG